MNRLQNRLAQLFAENPLPPSERTARFVNATDVTDVYVYAPIGGYFGLDAEGFVRDFAAITSPKVTLHVNSPGGDVFDGRAMAAAIRRHSAEVTCVVEGLCASIATALANASDRVLMEAGSRYMIHEAWSLAIGNKRDMEKTRQLLESVDSEIVDEYVAVTGKERVQIETWMEQETWFTAAEAIEHGFAAGMAGNDDEEDDEAAMDRLRQWNLSAYRNAPKIEQRAIARPNLAQMARRLELRQRLAK